MYGMQLIEQRSIDSKNNRAMFWRHPRMMASVVSIEAWERFSFYGMQAILGFYLYYSIADGGLGIAKKDATALIGAYGALVYLCTFIGGWVGDHLLGAEKNASERRRVARHRPHKSVYISWFLRTSDRFTPDRCGIRLTKNSCYHRARRSLR
ncbi:Dipeptide and tripeptide permease A [Corynebacterium diphtheriae]|nr:Dipeptide and tripeptide permease A [Corynebacterium diphtheriae]